jgi:hypothetical protein
MGGEPQTALAIATVPYGLEAKVEADLSAMMVGANEVLREAGCALVGGHTSEGAELALGFAVNGLVASTAALRKGGQAGGRAILNKPIGTDAARRHARQGKGPLGDGSDRAHGSVEWSGDEILRRHGVHAATDVTGFGLLGHLVEMVRPKSTTSPSAACRCSTAREKRWHAASSLSAAAECAFAPRHQGGRIVARIRSTRCCSTRKRPADYWRRSCSARRCGASLRCARPATATPTSSDS